MPAERRLQQLHFPKHHRSLLLGGTHKQSRSPHMASLALCFLPSVTRAADQSMCAKRRGYRNIEGSCLACSPVCQQKVSGVGVAMDHCQLPPGRQDGLDGTFQSEHHEGSCVVPPHHHHTLWVMTHNRMNRIDYTFPDSV